MNSSTKLRSPKDTEPSGVCDEMRMFMRELNKADFEMSKSGWELCAERRRDREKTELAVNSDAMQRDAHMVR